MGNKQFKSDVDRLTEKSPEILGKLETSKNGQLETQTNLNKTKGQFYEFRGDFKSKQGKISELRGNSKKKWGETSELQADGKITRDKLPEISAEMQNNTKKRKQGNLELKEKLQNVSEVVTKIQSEQKKQIDTIQSDLKTTDDENYEFRNVSQTLLKFKLELKKLRKEIDARQNLSKSAFIDSKLKFGLALMLIYLVYF